MNSHKLYRIKGTVCDLLLAVMILVFTLSVAMSATVGNVGFYSHFLDNKQITAELKTALDCETEKIAQKTGRGEPRRKESRKQKSDLSYCPDRFWCE